MAFKVTLETFIRLSIIAICDCNQGSMERQVRTDQLHGLKIPDCNGIIWIIDGQIVSKKSQLTYYALMNNALEAFHFRWLKIKGICVAFLVSLMLIFNNL